MTIFLLTVTTAIIGLFFNYCHNKLRDFEGELPKKVSYYFGNKNWAASEIIKELKRRQTLNIEESEKRKFAIWIKEYHSFINNFSIIKIFLFIDIIFIIVFAIYNMRQS